MAAKPSTEPTAQRGTIVKDPEMSAINAMNKALGILPEDARMRVLQFINSKWQPKPNFQQFREKLLTNDGGKSEA